MGLEADLQLSTRFERLVHVLSCDSTQALSMDDDGRESAVFWSDHQVAGRGRQGRAWHDAPAQDIAVTFRIANLALESPTLLAAAIPVAVVRAVVDEVRDIAIKWPNDILLHGRKLCGVLIDTSGQPPHTFHVGIGINVNRCTFPAEILDQSTSLALATGREFDRDAVLLRLAREVTKVADQLATGAFDSVVEDFQTRLGLTDKPVRATTGDQSVEGTLTHIDLQRATLDHQTQIPLAHLQHLTIKPVS
jgi:BirA family transcriptional regulator, biotin operon repressor / biotin---[acetyl-CoA-carboxylase] ligase